MKTILAKIIAVTFLFGSIPAACTGSPRPLIPTETFVPTVSPTSTITPTPAPLLLGKYQLLSPDDMRHDLDELFYQIEKVHPNPYTKRSKSDVDLERQCIYNELGEPMTMIDFYRKVDPFVSSLGDRHTYTILPREDIESFEKNELLLPLALGFDEQKARIISNLPGLPVGAQVLSINGIPVDHIDAFKPSFPGFSFWLEYGSFPEYQVEVLRDGETTPAILNIPGMTWDQIQQKSTSPKLNDVL